MPIVLCGGCSVEVCNSWKPCETPQESYVGAVLDTYEVNGYDDSDFFAVVWDDENQCVRSREYASTRGWTYHNGATVDATPEVVEKALTWYRERLVELRIDRARREACRPTVTGRRVRSLTTRGKVHGVTGVVGWVGKDRYARRWASGDALLRVGIDPDDGGTRAFVSGDRVELVGDPAPVDEAEIRESASAVTVSSNWQDAYRGLLHEAIRD